MQICKIRQANGTSRVGVIHGEHVRMLSPGDSQDKKSLSEILYSENPSQTVHDLLSDSEENFPLDAVALLAPLDRQEVWAAGVTYKRSREARERESAGAARFYDLVYSAPRPELFFKANPHRIAGHGAPVHIRRDSRWSVPEPELALVLSPKLQIVGYTIGNDMSARDIEGENPLYLPQAKIYDQCCGLGPGITLAEDMPPLKEVKIILTIEREGRPVFYGSTSLDQMVRPLEELVHWLGRETSFPDGAILLTGTGIVPPDDFSLISEDLIQIDITGIGRLINRVQIP